MTMAMQNRSMQSFCASASCADAGFACASSNSIMIVLGAMVMASIIIILGIRLAVVIMVLAAALHRKSRNAEM